jgi:hypothetical protein
MPNTVDFERDAPLRKRHPSPMQPKLMPILLRAWIECPACGHMDRFTKAFRLDAEVATPLFTKAPFICQRCGTHRAWLVMERTALAIH